MRIALLAATMIWASGCTFAQGGEDTDIAPSSADAGTVSPAADAGSGGAPTPATSAPADTGSTAQQQDTGSAAQQADTSPPPQPAPSSGTIDAARVACVDGINQYRATLKLPPYAGWSDADTCADGQAKADSIANQAHSAFGQCGESAQNECPGWPGPPDQMIGSCLQMMWAEGPGQPFSAHGHYINMSSTSYSVVSCGFYQTASGSWWAAQDFR